MANRLVSVDNVTLQFSPDIREVSAANFSDDTAPEFAGIDAAVSTLVPDNTSATGAAVETLVDARIAAGGGTPSTSGTYASRPAAGTVAPGTLYFTTDLPEVYRSDGAAWSVIGSGGNELGYAQIVANATLTSGTPTDIAGLTTTFVVGERPIELRFDGQAKTTAAATPVVVYILLDGVQKALATLNGLTADKYFTLSRRVRVSGLTPGSTHTAKIQWAGGGAMTIEASATNPAAVQVVNI